jgi:fructoselysine 6-kinase
VLATVGDNCIDRYLPPVGLSTVGGNAVNVAVHLARLGQVVAYFGAVGDDADGRRVTDALADHGVDVGHVRTVPRGTTATTDIRCGPAGGRAIISEDFGACRGYRPSAAEVALLTRARHVHIGWHDDGGALKNDLASAGVGVSQDLSVNAEARHVAAEGLTIAFAAADGWDRAEALADAVLGQGAALVVVTCGAAGSLAKDKARAVRMEARRVPVVDTLGAGDTFIAGFLDARLKGLDLDRCLAAGRDAAAATCGHYGGFPQEPLVFAPRR